MSASRSSEPWLASEVSTAEATIVVPTHDHGRLLSLSVRSALAQSIDAIEVFIVCDGATEDTLEAAEELRKSDERVRLFIHDKGPRHGEVYRHQALQEATGNIVCYLSDDDLWLPDHVEDMAGLLQGADFAHAYPIGFDASGALFSWPGHLSVDEVRESMLQGRNFIPLPCAAHTLELYHRLPHGWRTTPAGTHTDLYMWQQILSVQGVRLASGHKATVLHFPSSLRPDVTTEERFDELARWSVASRDPGFASEIDRRVHQQLAIDWARTDVHSRNLTAQLDRTRGRLTDIETELDKLDVERDALLGDLELADGRRRRAEDDIAALDQQLGELRYRLGWMTTSRTWRLRQAMLRIPGMTWLVRRIGTTRSR